MSATMGGAAAQAMEQVALLGHADPDMVGEALTWFAINVRMNPVCGPAFLAANPVPALVEVLKRFAGGKGSDGADMLMSICHAVAPFLEGGPTLPPQVDAFVAAGGIPPLLAAFKLHLTSWMPVEVLVPVLTVIARHGPRPLAALVDAGVIPLAVTALRSYSASDGAAFACYVAELLHPLASAEYVARVVDAGGLVALVDALKAFASADFTLQPVCRALRRLVTPLTPASLMHAAAIMAAGAIPVLVGALVAFVKDAADVTEFAALLAALTRLVPTAAESVPVEPLVAALAAHKAEAAITPVVTTISACALQLGDEAAWCATFVKAGGIRALLAALRVHMARAHVVAGAAQTLIHICREHVAAVIAAGGVDLCIAALAAHAGDKDATNCLCGLANEMAMIDDGLYALVKGGAVRLVLAAAQKYALLDDGSAYASIMVLSSLAADEEAVVPQLTAAKAVRLALAVLKRYAKMANVAQATLLLLGNMSVDHGARLQMVAEGGLPLVMATIKSYRADPLAVTHGMLWLSHIALDPPNWKVLAAEGAVPLAQEALRAHARVGAAAAASCRAMRRLAPLRACRPAIVTLATAQSALAALRLHPSDTDVHGGVCALLGEMVNEQYDSGTCWGSGSLPPTLLHFFDLAAVSNIIGAAVAAGIVPHALSFQQRMNSCYTRGDCDCGPNALVHTLTASKAGLAALISTGDAAATCRSLVHLVLQTPRVVCPGTSRYTLATVVRMAAHSRLRAVMVTAGVLGRVFNAFDSWIGMVSVEDRLCLVLFVRLAADPATCKTLVSRGGVASLCRFIKNVSAPVPKGRGAAAAPTADVSIDARLPSPAEDMAVIDALRGLANVAQIPAGRDAMTAAGAVRMVSSFVHADCKLPVVAAACACLRAYAMGDGCEAAIAAAGGVRALVNVTRAFASQPVVPEQACGALWNVLGSDDSAYRKAAVDAGALDALRAVMAAHPPASVVGRFAQGALDCCLAGGE